MPSYIYKVRDSAGKILKGQLDALDGKDLRRKLDESNYFIIDYTEKTTKKALFSSAIISRSRKVSMKDISVFSWQLFTMLDAGLPLLNTLKIIERQTRNEHLKSILNDVWHKVEGGTSFSDSLREHPKVFSRFYVQMVNAGEVGGVLDEMLKRLAMFYERQDEIRTKLRSSMTYPAVLLVVSICVVIFMVTFILPRFTNVFKEMGASVPFMTQFLLLLGVWIKNYWYVVIAGIVALFILWKIYVSTTQGRFRVDGFKLNLPIVGDLTRKTIAARFTQTLSTLLSGGIPILIALDVVTETIGNTVVTRSLKDIISRVGEGKSIATPLEESRIFPEMVVGMIRVGEETGSLDKMLEKIAQFYDREVISAIEMFTKLIEPFLIVFMTVVVGFIALSIFMPMADVIQSFHY